MNDSSFASEKHELETEKLRLEIKSLKKAAWRKRDFWSLIITAAISTASLILLIANGGFEFKSKELSFKRENLEYDIRKLNDKKDSVQSKIYEFKSDSIRLVSEIRALGDSNNNLINKRKELENIIQLLQRNRKYQESEFAKIIFMKNIQLDSIAGVAERNRQQWENAVRESAARKSNPTERLMAEYRSVSAELQSCKGMYLMSENTVSRLRLLLDSCLSRK